MMKRLALLFAISGMLLTAKADTVTQIFSSASTTTNNSVAEGVTNAGATVNIDTNSAWSGPMGNSSWVSFARTGDPSGPGFYVVPNGTAVTFAQTFNLNGTVTAGFLDVLADDTASVILNGRQIYNADLTGPYPTCSATAIGCLKSTEGIFTLAQLLPYLNTNGANTIDFTVYQEGGSSYGLDYSGSFTTSAPTATPEPGTLLLLGAGALALAFLKLRS
jgi:PEP-CTERM motif-containing protein